VEGGRWRVEGGGWRVNKYPKCHMMSFCPRYLPFVARLGAHGRRHAVPRVGKLEKHDGIGIYGHAFCSVQFEKYGSTCWEIL